MNLIIQQFEDWLKICEDINDEDRKDLYQQRMIGFIIALKLSNKNIEANKCKEMYHNLIG